MEQIIYFLSLIWLVRIFANVLSYIHLWWVKEYRFDRMRIHLQTSQGKNLLFFPFKRPLISPKTITLFLLISFSLLIMYRFLPLNWWLKLLFIDLLTFPVVSIWVGFLKVPTYFYHEVIIFLATKKIRKFPNLLVVGITGSFGKSSTKEFLENILSTKYKTLKTEGSKNSAIGVAEIILKSLNASYQIFVVEMAAYKIGEIERIAKMVKPQIGIITAINEQHQDLFGDIETTVKAKYELIANLTGRKIAIFNADNSYTLQMARRANEEKKNVHLYSTRLKKFPDFSQKNISASNIHFFPEKISFNLKFEKNEKSVAVKLLGIHQVNNILAGVSCALACGTEFKDIIKALSLIKPFTKTMELTKGINDARFINDTFNNNPDAAKAAINYLQNLSGKKILVFQPMIELGKFSEKAHKEVGKYAAEVCDAVFLTNNNFYTSFVKDLTEEQKKQVYILPTKKTAEKIKSVIDKNYTVLFKGKEADVVLKLLH